jgi:endonuclease YncB( thermonuclease family)
LSGVAQSEMRPTDSFTFRRSALFTQLLFCALAFSVSSCKPAPRTTSPAGSTTPIAQAMIGRVVRVADGDTITVLDANNGQYRVRLQGIDAPESHQAFGTQSKKSLSDMIFDKEVTVIYDKTDQYGRLVGKILAEGKDINLEQVKAGLAWHYKEYEREQSPEDREIYAHAEEEARRARRGLWAAANPLEPSEFRRDERREREAK